LALLGVGWKTPKKGLSGGPYGGIPEVFGGDPIGAKEGKE